MNALYAHGADRFATGDIDWINDDIRVAGVDLSKYTPNMEDDLYLSDIPALAQVCAVALIGKVTDGKGTMDADDVDLPATAAGSQITGLVLYKWTGNAMTSPLIALYDDCTGIPVLTAGAPIPIQWPESAEKILSLRVAP